MTNFKNYPNPHNHVQSLDSVSTIANFIKREIELETGYVTATDHGYLGGCKDLYDQSLAKKIKPILGVEGYHRDDNCEILKRHGIEKDDKDSYKKYYKYGHITMHAKDQQAYEALVKRISIADQKAEKHGSERKPIFTWNDLAILGQENMTFTSGCLIGMCSRHLMADRPDIAVDYYEKARSLAKPGNFYVELFHHRCDKNWVSGVFITLEDGTKLKFSKDKKLATDEFPEDNPISASDLAKLIARGKSVGKLRAIRNYRTWTEVTPREITKCEFIQDFLPNECSTFSPDGDIQLASNKFLIELANKYGDKLLISDDAHYPYPEDKEIQDAKLGGMGDNFRFYGLYSRFASNDVYNYFKTYLGMSEKQFEELIDNNYEWASNFDNFKLDYEPTLPTKFYPELTLEHFKTLVKKQGRMDWRNPDMVARLRKELKTVSKNGKIDLTTYFFTGEEVCDEYEKFEQLTGAGRGSAGGMFIAYLLGITHLDPIRWDLSDDRFLTENRILSGKMPDIDFDLPHRRVLEGTGKDYYETKLSNGQVKYFWPGDKLKTVEFGWLPIEEVFEKGLEFDL